MMEKTAEGCHPACRGMMLSLLAQQRENTINGLFRVGYMAICCGASAVIGVIICRLV